MTLAQTASEVSLEDELRLWWRGVEAESAALVGATSRKALPGGADLWSGIPVVDSKVVAETAPIFERKLGIKLDTKLVRPGGYLGIEHVISDLVPKMKKLAQSKKKASEHNVKE